MKVEEKNGVLLIQSDEGKDIQVVSNDWSLLKYKTFKGEKVVYAFNKTSSVVEEDQLALTLSGEKVHLIPEKWPTKSATARAIFSHMETKRMEEFVSLWSYIFLSQWLGLGISLQPRGLVDIERDNGDNLVPHMERLDAVSEKHRHLDYFPHLRIKEKRVNKDGSKVAMLLFSGPHPKNQWFFTRRVPGPTPTPIEVHYETAVALVGRDEAKNAFLHYVPPDYKRGNIDDLERYLVNAKPDDIINASWTGR